MTSGLRRAKEPINTVQIIRNIPANLHSIVSSSASGLSMEQHPGPHGRLDADQGKSRVQE